ncbi:MAG: HEAT repeat domain-containing protein [Myxococcales bacterium]|nr:HEAT repeat domain-containing protein [Myxococcales bacterium]
MGFLDFLFKRDSGSGSEAALMRHGERVLDKRAMSPDRFASIEYLCKIQTEEGWRALLPRYNFTVDPGITDREEKQYIFDHITRDADSAVEPVKEFLRKSNAINWPIKMLRELLSAEDFVAEMLSVLAAEGTDYQKNPERKIQCIMAVEEMPDPRIAPAVVGFLDDVNEDTRFHTVRTLLKQGDATVVGALAALLAREDSMRIKTTIADGLAETKWAVEGDAAEKVRAVLPKLPTGPYSFGSDGVISKR